MPFEGMDRAAKTSPDREVEAVSAVQRTVVGGGDPGLGDAWADFADNAERNNEINQLKADYAAVMQQVAAADFASYSNEMAAIKAFVERYDQAIRDTNPKVAKQMIDNIRGEVAYQAEQQSRMSDHASEPETPVVVDEVVAMPEVVPSAVSDDVLPVSVPVVRTSPEVAVSTEVSEKFDAGDLAEALPPPTLTVHDVYDIGLQQRRSWLDFAERNASSWAVATRKSLQRIATAYKTSSILEQRLATISSPAHAAAMEERIAGLTDGMRAEFRLIDAAAEAYTAHRRAKTGVSSEAVAPPLAPRIADTALVEPSDASLSEQPAAEVSLSDTPTPGESPVSLPVPKAGPVTPLVLEKDWQVPSLSALAAARAQGEREENLHHKNPLVKEKARFIAGAFKFNTDLSPDLMRSVETAAIEMQRLLAAEKPMGIEKLKSFLRKNGGLMAALVAALAATKVSEKLVDADGFNLGDTIVAEQGLAVGEKANWAEVSPAALQKAGFTTAPQPSEIPPTVSEADTLAVVAAETGIELPATPPPATFAPFSPLADNAPRVPQSLAQPAVGEVVEPLAEVSASAEDRLGLPDEKLVFAMPVGRAYYVERYWRDLTKEVVTDATPATVRTAADAVMKELYKHPEWLHPSLKDINQIPVGLAIDYTRPIKALAQRLAELTPTTTASITTADDMPTIAVSASGLSPEPVTDTERTAQLETFDEAAYTTWLEDVGLVAASGSWIDAVFAPASREAADRLMAMSAGSIEQLVRLDTKDFLQACRVNGIEPDAVRKSHELLTTYQSLTPAQSALTLAELLPEVFMNESRRGST